jgi:hypothetical protein
MLGDAVVVVVVAAGDAELLRVAADVVSLDLGEADPSVCNQTFDYTRECNNSIQTCSGVSQQHASCATPRTR